MKNKKIISLNNKKNRYLLLDTETVHSNLALTRGGDDMAEIKDVIELSYKILDYNGTEIIGTRKGFIVKEIWDNKKYLYSKDKQRKGDDYVACQNFAINKIKWWRKSLRDNTLKLASMKSIMWNIDNDIKNYNVTLITAFNIRFDRQAIFDTIKLVDNNIYTNFWKLDFVDIMKMAKVVVGTGDYKKWCINHGAITPSGNYKTSAEAIFQYLTNNSEKLQTKVVDSTSWNESHLAINDIDCEGVILQNIIAESRRLRQVKVLANAYGNWCELNKVIKVEKTSKRTIKKIVQQLELKLD